MADENKENMSGFWQTLVIAISVMLLAIFGVFAIHKWIVPNDVALSDANLTIVLSFIGVLATFIVIGNFAQVSDIRRKMEQDIENIKTKEIEPIKTGLGTIEGKVAGHTTSITDIGTRIAGIDASIGRINSRIDDVNATIAQNKEANEKYAQEQVSAESLRIRTTLKQYKRLVLESLFASYGDVKKVEAIINKLSSLGDEDNFFLYVYRARANSTITAKATLTEKGIVFSDEAGNPISVSSIKKIDSIDIKPQQLYTLYCIYQDAITIMVEDYSGNIIEARTEEAVEEGDDNHMDLNN